MALSPSATRELFDQECRFPTDRRAVIDAVGDTHISAQGGESATIETVLRRSEQTSFESLPELHSTVMANLDDDHVGRTDYDDRSSNPSRDDEVSL